METEEGALDAIDPKQAMNSFTSDWAEGHGSWFDRLSISGAWSPSGSKPSVIREPKRSSSTCRRTQLGVVPKIEMTTRGLAPDLTSPSGESLV